MEASVLLGRQEELGVLHELVGEVDGHGAALVVRGDAGIGKSSLVTAAIERARTRGMFVLSTAGVQSETHLAFAGLHLLLRPVLAGAERLPRPQRDALGAAFGMTDAAVPDLFLVALATLDLLGEAAARSPLLLVAEDAHWLDSPTSEVLAFVARRLISEPIVLLSAIRDGYDSPLLEAELPELRVEQLSTEAAGALLDATAPKLSPARRALLLEEAAGNPLALVELPYASRSDLANQGSVPLAFLPLTQRLERAFAGRQSELPPATRSLLLVAAADDGGSVAEILEAGAALEGSAIGLEGLTPAVSARLIEVNGSDLRFRHPLVRSAIYRAATIPKRRAAHAALAETLSDQLDRRFWHLAAAAIGPDEDVASGLEEAALRAERRGAIAVAIVGLERSAELSDPTHRVARLLHAAELAFELGRQDLVLHLIEGAEREELGTHERARVAWLREVFNDGVPGDPMQVHSLVEIAEETRLSGDTDLALKLLLGAALRTWWADPGEEAAERVLAAADGLGVYELDPRLLAILAVAAPPLRSSDVADRMSRIRSPSVTDPAAGWMLGMAAHSLANSEMSTALLAGAAGGLRAQGRLALLAQVLIMQAWGEIHLGNWSVATPLAEEGGRLARETVQPIWVAGSQIAEALLAGMRGDEEQAEALAEQAEQVIVPQHLSSLVGVLQLARGLQALTAGRYDAAYEHLHRMFDPTDPAHHRRERYGAIVYFADAAVRCGRREEALALVEEFERLAAQTGFRDLRMAVLYARPFVADEGSLEAAFEAAFRTDASRWPFLRARLQLAYGIWLRHHRRAAESRAPLRTARDVFDALRATPWGDRARRELRASGETSRPRTATARESLTSQELQIAQKAAEGLTNREIGQQLYLSHRTVASHLYRVFPKLGISSRLQLRTALGSDAVPTQ